MVWYMIVYVYLLRTLGLCKHTELIGWKQKVNFSKGNEEFIDWIYHFVGGQHTHIHLDYIITIFVRTAERMMNDEQ